MVNIGILRRGFRRYSNKRLVEEGRKRGKVIKIYPQNLFLNFDKELSFKILKQNMIPDVVAPRFGSSNYEFNLMALQHFERMGMPLINSYHTVVTCKNKYLTNLALKKKNLPQPRAALALSEKEMIHHIKHIPKPFVIKLIESSFGMGVSLIKTEREAKDYLETLKRFRTPLYIQEYIPHPGEDFRIFVINYMMVAAMRRVAKKGEWKANIHLGAKGYSHKPSKEMIEISVRTAEAVKADVCGVDIMEHNGKMRVIEVNHNPFFKGLEKATGKNIAKEIINFAVRKARR